MSVFFFLGHAEWIRGAGQTNCMAAKRFSDDLFVPRSNSFPLNQDKKALIPYIYNNSNKDSF